MHTAAQTSKIQIVTQARASVSKREQASIGSRGVLERKEYLFLQGERGTPLRPVCAAQVMIMVVR